MSESGDKKEGEDVGLSPQAEVSLFCVVWGGRSCLLFFQR